MMKTKNFIAISITILIVGLLLSSCQHCIDGQGSIKKEKRGLNSFKAIDVSIAADINIKKGDTTIMIIEAPENIISTIKSKVKRGTLHITAPCFHTKKSVKINLTVKSISKISLSGSGKIRVQDAISSKKLKLFLSGSGNIETDVLTPRVDAEIDGSGLIIINGITEELNVDIEGSGVFRALGLRTKRAYTEINGSGEIFVTAVDKLKATISGSGIIHYSGSPNIKSNINGTGKVSKVD